MELFQKLDKIMAEGTTLTINIAKSKDSFTVSVFPGHSLVKDAAKNRIQPLNMTGKAEDFDNGFENAVIAPMQQSLGLLTKMKDFEDGVEAVRKASEMEKKAKEEAKKNSTNFSKWMELADKNLKESKFKDAITCAKNALQYADKVAGGKAKADELIKKATEQGAGGLFGDMEDKSDGKNVKIDAKNPEPAKAETQESDDDDNE